MQVKTNVKAGTEPRKITTNHNEAQMRAAARGLKVQTGVKAGGKVRMQDIHFMMTVTK
jgi:hypothetical protein